MHSIDLNGNICVNLQDYVHISDSIRFREKIEFLLKKHGFPSEISNFSITMIFNNGKRHYLSNLYLWAIPYRTEGLYRGDVDHDPAVYEGKEFFIQRDIKYDEMQIPIIQLLETRYKLHTTFAMYRPSPECNFIIEAYNEDRITDPEKLYFEIRDKFENFIVNFLDSMETEMITALPQINYLPVLRDKQYRRSIITRQNVKKKLLSERELECLIAFSEGLSMQEVARQFHISNETVNTHAKAIRRKLDSKTMIQAVMTANRYGLLTEQNTRIWGC